MVTYKYVNDVVRNRCIKHQAKSVDSSAILLLFVTSDGDLIIQIIKSPSDVTNRRSIALESTLFA